MTLVSGGGGGGVLLRASRPQSIGARRHPTANGTASSDPRRTRTSSDGVCAARGRKCLAYLSRCRHVPEQVADKTLSSPLPCCACRTRSEMPASGDDRAVGRHREGVSGLRLHNTEKQARGRQGTIDEARSRAQATVITSTKNKPRSRQGPRRITVMATRW